MERQLKVGIGASQAERAVEAGREAASAAVAGLAGAPPALVIVYSSLSYDLPALLASIRGVTGEAPLVGATSCGQFHEGSYVEIGRGVQVLVLSGGQYRFGASSGEGVFRDPQGVGRAIARGAREAAGSELPAHGAMLLFVEGLGGQQEGVLEGIYAVTGAGVPVVGGSCADDRRFSGTFAFHDDRVLADGAVAVWIASERPLRVVSKHGWKPIGLPVRVTAVDGTHIREIAGRPSMQVYRERVREELGHIEPGIYSSIMASYPIGLIQPDGSYAIRAARVVDDEDDLQTFTPLPEFAAISVMTGDADDLLAVTEPLVAEALEGTEASLLLAFSCAGRQDILLDRVAEEVGRIQAAAGEVPTFGMYSYGEFARTKSVAGLHNATITAMAL